MTERRFVTHKHIEAHTKTPRKCCRAEYLEVIVESKGRKGCKLKMNAFVACSVND